MQTNHQIIGREDELAALTFAIDTIREGTGRFILIAGEAGAGKTTLAEECLAACSCRVLTGRASEDATPPYGPIASVLRDTLKLPGVDTLSKVSLLPHLGVLLPELGRPPRDTQSQALVEAIIELLVHVTKDDPAIIFLDDLQWADNATFELLPTLCDRLQNENLLILGTYRSDEIPRGHRIRWLRNELRRQRRLEEIVLKPLTRNESAALMRQVLQDTPAPALAKTVFDKTLGVPFFVEELSITLVEQGLLRKEEGGLALAPGTDVPIPESVRDAVLLRLDGLSEAARKLLEMAAIAGMEFDLPLIMTLTGEEAGMDELLERNLIVETSQGRGAFRHALTREAVRSAILWSQRRSMNRKIAEYLESSGAPPGQVGEHWLAANEHGKARMALLASAEQSCALYAYLDAARAAHRALEIWPDGEDEETRLAALERLAHCAQVSGQLADAVRALREVIEHPITKGDQRRLAEAQRSLATIYGLQGAWEQSLNARTASAEAFEKAGAKSEAAIELLAAARRNYGMLNQAKALELSEKAAALADGIERWDIKARALALKGDMLSSLGRSDDGIATVQAGLSLALQHNLTDAASEVYRRLGSALEYASQFTASRDAYYTAYNYCQTQGVDSQAQLCLSCMTYVLFRTGDWKQALQVSREVINDKSAAPGSKGVALCVMGLINYYRGETRKARKQLLDAYEIARKERVAAMEPCCIWGLALVEEAEGSRDKAERYYRQVLAVQQANNDLHDSLPTLCAAASFFAMNHLEKETIMCVKALSDIAAATGNPEALGALGFALGENAILNGKPEEAARQFAQAQSNFEKIKVPVEQMRTEFRLGIAYALSGAQSEAGKHLLDSYRIAKKLGCRPLAAQISVEIEAMGIQAEERRSSEASERIAHGGLTRRQMEIVQLIAAGLTNREIAEKLFLSPRTVEMHVANLLNRLDCRTRSEAVRKASDLELLD